MARRHERPKPVGTVIGVVVCLGAIGGFLLLYNMTDIFRPRQRDATLTPPPNADGTRPPVSRNGTTRTTRPPKPAAPNQVIVEFKGSFTKEADTRKVVYRCPYCRKEILDVGIPKCPNLECAKSIKWPEKIKCGFCGGPKRGGICPVCKGTGKCPKCANRPRLLMGVRQPCEFCHDTGKCPACGGDTKTCDFCEGGWYYPGKPKLPRKTGSSDLPSIPKPKKE